LRAEFLKLDAGLLNQLQLVNREHVGQWIKTGSTPFVFEDKLPELSIILF
jgi:hypothetical protein